MSQRVFITGIRGFVGTAIAEELRRRGYHVVGSQSGQKQEKPDGISAASNEAVVIRLGDEVDPRLFAGCSAIVHCAHSAHPGQVELNVDGTRKIADAARAAGVATQIFISSYTALSDADTEYAQVKKRLESRFTCVVRPGLVIGAGGLFERMMRVVRRSPLVPVIDGGLAPVPVVWAGDLAFAVGELIGRPRDGQFNLFNKQKPRMIDLLRIIRSKAGGRALFVPIPSALLVLMVRVFQALRVKLPISEESVKGYVSNGKVEVESDLTMFVTESVPLPAMIDLLLAANGGARGVRADLQESRVTAQTTG